MKNSEILEEILKKVTNIETRVNLNDFQQKLIIQKLNARDLTLKNDTIKQPPISSSTGPGKVVSPDSEIEITQKEDVVQKNKLMSISKNKNENPYQFDTRELSNKNTNTEALSGNENEISNNLRGFPVTQKLTFDASIKIKNYEGDIVKETQTNTSGRWQAVLKPGKYIADVEGKKDNEKVSFTQSFEVVSSTAPINLLMPEMYKRQFE